MAVIPARGGSKGIPRKNIKPLAGKPLIAWSIEAARRSKLVDRVVVSTDDGDIAAVARDFDAEVLERPGVLAGDKSTTLSVLLHAYANIPCDAMVLLQPTSPVRRPGLVDDCIREFQRADGDSLATGWWCTYTEYGTNVKPRQDIRGFFYDDGNVYVISGALLKKGERYGANIVRKVISREENVDIDEDFDFWMAEKIIAERMNG